MTHAQSNLPCAPRFSQSENVAHGISMTSLELVDFINAHRKEQAELAGAKFPGEGFSKLQHKHFLDKVPEVLGETSAKYSANLPDSYVRPRKGYRFPKREACLMAMSYSYELQAAVFDHMTDLEESAKGKVIAVLPDFSNPAAAARAWAEQFERQQAALEHADLMKKVPKVLKKDAGRFSDIYLDSMSRRQKCYRQRPNNLGTRCSEYTSPKGLGWDLRTHLLHPHAEDRHIQRGGGFHAIRDTKNKKAEEHGRGFRIWPPHIPGNSHPKL